MQETITDIAYSNYKFDGWRQVQKSITFDGGTTNAIGDYDGTGNPFSIFSVTGDVIAKVLAVCTTNLAGGSATLSVGVVGTSQSAKIIAVTTATDITAGEIWHDATPDSFVEASSVMAENVIANGANIIGTVGTANITSGVMKFICLWKPLSSNGGVEAA